MGTMWQDVRFAMRTLRRGWMVTALAVLSLALAIGGNAAVFSMVDAFLYRPLPYPEPDRLVLVAEREKDQPPYSSSLATSLPGWADLVERSRLVERWGAMQPTSLSLRGTGGAEPVSGVRVAGDFLELLGITPVRGRLFTAEERVEGGRNVVLLGHDWWSDRYGPETEVLGEVLVLDGIPHEVIGVLPAGFDFLTPNQDLWVPIARSPESVPRDQRTVIAVGRLRADATMDQAREEMVAIASRIEEEHPGTQRGRTLDTFNLRHEIPDPQTRMLFGLLQGSVLLVLLIACVNVTNLLLARGQERASEIALRTVLGAGRRRIVRQLLTESSIMVAAGAALGLGLGALGIRAIHAQFAAVLPSTWAVQLDERVLGFTLAVSALAGLLFGTVPAIQTFRQGQAQALKEWSERGGGAGGRKRLSRALVVAEIALSFVALGGGSLMIRSFLELQSADPGFEPGPVLTATMSVPTSKYLEDADRVLLNDAILERAAGVAGVERAAVASTLPQSPFATPDTFRVDAAGGQPEVAPRAIVASVSPGYLDVFGIAVRQGRFFEAGDLLDTAPVAVVNEALVRSRFGASPDVLGRRITVRGKSREIVGVAPDIQMVLFRTPATRGGEAIYLPAAQEPAGASFVVTRARGNPEELAEPLRIAVQGLDPDLALSQLLTMEQFVEQFFVGIQVFNVVLGGFGLFALLLAALGTYGVLAYTVSRRSHEIGIRMALGAESGRVVRMIARQGLWLAGMGLVLGGLVTLPLIALMQSLLEGLSTVQPSTLLFIGAVLFAVTAAASFFPAGRAARVDPMRTLRGQ